MPEIRTLILDEKKIGQKINRIAWQIYENFYKEDEIILAGIIDNGFILAQRIAEILKEISPIKITVIKVQLNKTSPLSEEVKTDLSAADLEKKVVVVVDDVLDSGRTMIYGVKHFLDFGVKHLKTVVLVDRSHRLFPVKADFVGISLATTLQEQIRVEFGPDGKDAAYLM